MLLNSRKLKKPGLSANRPLNNWALGSILLRRRIKNIRILHPHDSGFIAYSKISTLESGFKKLRTRIADSPDTCGRKLYPERKSCGFKNIRIFVDGALKTWFDKR